MCAHFLKTWNAIWENILDTGYAKEVFQMHAEWLDECSLLPSPLLLEWFETSF